VLRKHELETAGLIFNTNDFDVLDRYAAASRSTWLTYAPRDRGRITSQHGLQELLFVRKGSLPDLATQIDNARRKVKEAEAAVRTAQRQRDDARRALAEVEGGEARAALAVEGERDG
jgi:hypothetical protein